MLENTNLKRPLALSDSFAYTPENIEKANNISLIHNFDIIQDTKSCRIKRAYVKYEKQIIEIFIKLLLHITLISIFETLFYFLYVSSLEDNGIETTINTFINDASNQCLNITSLEIKIIDELLDPIINTSLIIANGNIEENNRIIYNNKISNKAWIYVGGMMSLFSSAIIYVKIRKIKVSWRNIIFENVAMVFLLALYELMFFNTIIYEYHPISTDEIARNAIQKIQNSCGILK